MRLFSSHAGSSDYYSPGNWNVVCDRTGFKVKASECRQEWNQLYVRSLSWEPRHPQDKIKGIVDDQRVPIARPPADDVFLSANEVQPEDL